MKSARIKRIAIAATLITIAETLGCAVEARGAFAQTPARTTVDVGGHKVSALVLGSPHPNVPTVVFENGFGSPLAVWTEVQRTIADSTRTIAYERPGVGQSEPSTSQPTVTHTAAELHELLGKLGAKPPYVLVGHSWGGPLIRTFAATYPGEVLGLVYVDPTDFTETAEEMRALGDKAGIKDAANTMATLSDEAGKALPAGVRAENSEIARLMRGGFKELRDVGAVPRVPTAVLLAGRIDAVPPAASFPGNADVFVHGNRDMRIAHFSALIDSLPAGTLVLTSKSGHFIQLLEPELVTEQVRRVLTAATPHPELDRLTGRYQLAPNATIAIARDGDRLTLQLTGPQTFRLRRESPTRFAVEVVGGEVEFTLDAAGVPSSATLCRTVNHALRRAFRERARDVSLCDVSGQAHVGIAPRHSPCRGYGSPSLASQQHVLLAATRRPRESRASCRVRTARRRSGAVGQWRGRPVLDSSDQSR